MPSKESQILADVYQFISSRQAANPDMELRELRTLFENLQSCGTEPSDVTYEEVDVAGVPSLWVKPVNAPSSRVILYFHGGGFVLMGPSSHRKLCGHLAKAANTQVLIPDYRLAPENPWPAQLEDAVTAYRWLLERGMKSENIATAGDSAGGNLCTSIVLKLRSEGVPLPGAIVAFSPWYDMEFQGATMESNAKTDVLVHKEVVQLMANLVGADKTPKDPLINPLYADAKGLPPMYINCGTHETLQDDSVRFAQIAKKAGVDVTLDETEGMQHVHVFMAGRAPEADSVLASVGKFLREKLST